MRITIEDTTGSQPIVTHVASSHAGEPGQPKAVAADPHDPAPSKVVQEIVTLPKRRHPFVVILVLLLLIAVCVVAVSFFIDNPARQNTSDAYIEGRIVRISPKVSGQVIALHVDDNATVKAGDVLLEIDPADYQVKVDQATAAVAAAESSVSEAHAAVDRAQAAVGEAQAATRVAATEAQRRASDYRRYKAMGTDGISAQDLETARFASDAADDQVHVAEKREASAAAELEVAQTRIATSQAQVAAAKAQLSFAQLQLRYTKVYATESGMITKKNVEGGDFVSTGQPLLAIVPTDKWIIANFKEIQLKNMRIGQPAEVHVDAFPDKVFRANIQSLQAGTGSRFELLPPENATGNWVKVVQRLPVKLMFDPGQGDLDHLAQGMSVEVTIDLRSGGAP